MYHIERELKYLRAMVGNKVSVEGSIVESFLLKEITYFSSVYFAEEHNVNTLTLRYNVDEEPPLSDLKKFQWRGTISSSNMTCYHTQEEQYLMSKQIVPKGATHRYKCMSARIT